MTENRNITAVSEKVAPRVPIKTYKWEDIRRQKQQGGYPWTHLYKRRLSVEDINTLYQVKKRKTMSDQRVSIPIDSCPDLNLEEATSLDDISQYLDKDPLEVEAKNVPAKDHLLKTPATALSPKKSLNKRAKSEEFCSKRRPPSSNSKRSASKLEFINSCIRKIKNKLSTSEAHLEKVKDKEIAANTKEDKLKKATECRKNVDEKPVYIHIPLKPPPGQADEFSYLEFEANGKPSSNLLSPVSKQTNLTRSFDNIATAHHFLPVGFNRKRRYSDENPNDIVAFEILKSQTISVKHHSTAELNINGTQQSSDIYIIQPNCDNIDQDDVAIIILEGDDISDNKENIQNNKYHGNSKKTRAKSMEPEKRRKLSIESGYSGQSLSKMQALKQKLKKNTIGKFRSFSSFKEGGQKKTSRRGTTSKARQTPSTSDDSTQVQPTNNKKVENGTSGTEPVYIHVPLKPPPGQIDEYSHLEFETEDTITELASEMEVDAVPNATDGSSDKQHIIVLTPPLEEGKIAKEVVSEQTEAEIKAPQDEIIKEDSEELRQQSSEKIIVDEEDGLKSCEPIKTPTLSDTPEGPMEIDTKEEKPLVKRVSFKRRVTHEEATEKTALEKAEVPTFAEDGKDEVVNKWSNISDHEYEQIDFRDKKSSVSSQTKAQFENDQSTFNKIDQREDISLQTTISGPTTKSITKVQDASKDKKSETEKIAPKKEKSRLSVEIPKKLRLQTQKIKNNIRTPKMPVIRIRKPTLPHITLGKSKLLDSIKYLQKTDSSKPVKLPEKTSPKKPKPDKSKEKKDFILKSNYPDILSQCKKVHYGLDKFFSKRNSASESKPTIRQISRKTTKIESIPYNNNNFAQPKNGIPKRSKRKQKHIVEHNIIIDKKFNEALTDINVLHDKAHENIREIQNYYPTTTTTDGFERSSLKDYNDVYPKDKTNLLSNADGRCVFEEINSDEFLLRQKNPLSDGSTLGTGFGARLSRNQQYIEDDPSKRLFFKLKEMKPVKRKKKSKDTKSTKEISYKPYGTYRQSNLTMPTAARRNKRKKKKVERLYENIDNALETHSIPSTLAECAKESVSITNILSSSTLIRSTEDLAPEYPKYSNVSQVNDSIIKSSIPIVPSRKHRGSQHHVDQSLINQVAATFGEAQETLLSSGKKRSHSYSQLQGKTDKYESHSHSRCQSIALMPQQEFSCNVCDSLLTLPDDGTPIAESSVLNDFTFYATVDKEKPYLNDSGTQQQLGRSLSCSGSAFGGATRPPRRKFTSIKMLNDNFDLPQPHRPPRRKYLSRSTSKASNVGGQIIQTQNLNDFNVEQMIDKMKDRPLPAPPRPPRKTKSLHSIVQDEQKNISEAIRIPSEELNYIDDVEQTDELDEIRRIVHLMTPTHYTHEETVTHAALIVEPLRNLNIEDSHTTIHPESNVERRIPVVYEGDINKDSEPNQRNIVLGQTLDEFASLQEDLGLDESKFEVEQKDSASSKKYENDGNIMTDDQNVPSPFEGNEFDRNCPIFKSNGQTLQNTIPIPNTVSRYFPYEVEDKTQLEQNMKKKVNENSSQEAQSSTIDNTTRTLITPVAPHRRHARNRQESSSSSNEMDHMRRSSQQCKPTISELGFQLFEACGTTVQTAIKHLVSQLSSSFRESHPEAQNEMHAIIIILLVLIVVAILLNRPEHKTIHHHHWEYFNPPRDL